MWIHKINQYIELIILYHILYVSQLHDQSYSDIIWAYDMSRSYLWSPKTPLNVWPDFKPIQQCDTYDFINFQPNLNKLSFISNQLNGQNETLLGFGFNEKACILLNQTSNDHEFLGASSQALKINQDLSIFVYCDPLWRAGSKVPVVQQSLELADFCQTGMQVATPCAAGQSIALSLDEVNGRLWVGEPLSTPHGRIQILTDLYGTMKLITIPRPENTESMAIGSFFGYALTEGFVTAPGLLNREQGNYTNPIHLVGIHLAKSTRDTTNGFYGIVDWFPETSMSDQFSGNGMSVLRVHLKGPYIKSVIMGAPYARNTEMKENKTDSTQSTVYNRGRIYLFCQSDHGISLKSDMHQVSTTFDYLDGPKGSTNFGFALTNLGDFDGDGNDDVAVGAPDLENTTGFSHIYLIRVLSTCQFDRTPLHILTSPQGAYDFGAHLPSHTSDLDFNGLNDLVVPISSSKQTLNQAAVVVYATRRSWTAECHFTFHHG
ncbi:unnamed protein product [Heterobilharzia americana]|nr:unnamed protein product [Heterobilharzia americana]